MSRPGRIGPAAARGPGRAGARLVLGPRPTATSATTSATIPSVVAREPRRARVAAGRRRPDRVGLAAPGARRRRPRRDRPRDGPAPAPEADAVVTAVPGLPLAVVTADCAPLVVACDDAVGVVHAGHRGLAAGVIEAAIARLRELGTGEVHAFLGPCIRAPRATSSARPTSSRFVAQFGPERRGPDARRPARARHPGRDPRRARTRGRRRVRRLRRVHRRTRRRLLLRTARDGDDRSAGDDRGPAVTERDVAERLADVRDRIARRGARVGPRPGRGDARRRDARRSVLDAVARRARGRRDRSRREPRAGARRARPRRSRASEPAPRWHFIGRLQRNKVRVVAPHVALWQSIDRDDLAAEVGAARAGRRGARAGQCGG